MISISDSSLTGVLVKPDVAKTQHDTDAQKTTTDTGSTVNGVPGTVQPEPTTVTGEKGTPSTAPSIKPLSAKRFHGSVTLDPARVGRDASRIADEVIAHLVGLVGSSVKVTLEIEATVPSGTPENVVRIVTENSRTLKFDSHGFEQD